MLNHITLQGRLVRSPELRYTNSNTPVCSFTLAVDRDRKADGEKVTDFIDCVAWRNFGEFISKHFQKGSMAVVTGRLQIREWSDKTDNKHKTAEVVVENIFFCDSKRPTRTDTSTFHDIADDVDGDLPF